jgi:UDPglucose 6-dehydrogenase
MRRLSVVGLGKLGACTATCFASAGYEVIDIDVNKHYVDLINKGVAPILEPGLQELITAYSGRLKATQDYEEAIKNSDITFLIVPTPSEPGGVFSDKYLKDALKPLATSLRKNDKPYHQFVITSTVSPGTTEENLIPLIEECSGKKLNKGFSVCYNPEFIALGSVINDFFNPDLLLIGESNTVGGDRLVEIYNNICKNKPYIARMSIISAEITKISLNAYVTMKISFANGLANICEKIPNADVDAITKALGADKRISSYFIKSGPPFGGPCFPRDNKAFIAFAKKYDQEAKLAKATEEVNEFQSTHLTEVILKNLHGLDARRVSILGLAYKPKTPVIEESPAIKIINELLGLNVKVTVYDPMAMENARQVFGDKIDYANSIKDCLSRSPLCVITTQENEFKTIDDTFLVQNPLVVIDCWRILDSSKFKKSIKYIAVGKGEAL